MSLTSKRELDEARDKLRLLERIYAGACADTSGDDEVREAELDSLQQQINQFKEEIARFEAHHPVVTPAQRHSSTP